MQVKDVESIFGISTNMVDKYGKSYIKMRLLTIIIDLGLLWVLILATGNDLNDKLFKYLLVGVVIAIIVNIIVSTFTNTDYYSVYKFYRKYKKRKVEQLGYNVTTDNLFSILFCTGYMKVKPDQSRDVYIEAIRNACCMNTKYSRRIMKYMSKYEDCENPNLTCQVIKGRKNMIVEVL